MTVVAAELLVKVGADTSEATQSIQSFRSGLNQTAADLGRSGAYLTAGITTPLIGAGVAAVKFSTDFNAAMANVASLGLAPERVLELKGNIQDMALEVGKSTDDLAGGLYQVVSAFGDTNDTVEILNINARAAAAGLATTTDAINLTSAVTKGYGDTSAEALQHVANLAFKTVEMGQTTFPELASSMGKVVPLAAELGISQEELFAVMATGTGVTGNASEVVTQLRSSMQALMSPTESMTGLIENMGFASGKAMIDQLGYHGSILAITQAAEASGKPLGDFMGRVEGQVLALALAGPQADVYTEKLAAMGDVTGAVDAAFRAQTEGINATGFAMRNAGIRAEILMQKLGDGIAPAIDRVIALAEPLVGWVEGLIDTFTRADEGTQLMIVGLAAFAAAIGPVMLGLAGMAAALAFLLTPIGAIVAAVAALGAVWITDFGGIRTATMEAAEAIGDFAANVMATLSDGNAFAAWVATLPAPLQNVIGWLQGAADAAISFGNYLATAAIEGDVLNDWLTHIPAPLQEFAQWVGQGAASLGALASHIRETLAAAPTLQAGLRTLATQGITYLGNQVMALNTRLRTALAPLVAGYQRLRDIIAGFAAGDLEPARQALVDTFDAIRSFDISAVIQVMAGAAGGIRDAIVNSFNQLDLPALRDTIIGKLGLDNFKLFPEGEGIDIGSLPTDLGRVSTALRHIAVAAAEFVGIDLSGLTFDVKGLQTAIIQQLNLVDFGIIAIGLRLKVTKALQDLTWEDVKVGTGDLKQEIIRQLADVDFTQIATGLRIKAQGAFRGIAWDTLPPIDVEPLRLMLQTNVDNAQQKLAQFFGTDNVLTRFIGRVTETVNTISEMMTGAATIAPAERFNRVVSSVVATLTLIGETRFDVLQTATRQIARLAVSLMAFSTSMVDNVDAEKIAGVLSDIVTEFTTQLSTLVDAEVLTDIGTAAGNLISSFVTKLGEVLGAEGFGEDIGAAVGKATVALAEGATALVTGLAGELNTADFAEFQASSKTFVEEFAKGLISAIPEMDFGALASTLSQALIDAVVEHVKQMSPLSLLGAPGMAAEAGLESAGMDTSSFSLGALHDKMAAAGDTFVATIDAFFLPEIDPVVWSEHIDSPDWTNMISDPVWSDVIDSPTWPESIATFDWKTFVDALIWPEAIAAFDWGTWITDLVWPESTGTFDWNTWISELTWPSATRSFNWNTWISTLIWPPNLFVFDWNTWVSSLSWGSFIDRLTWPSAADILRALTGVLASRVPIPETPASGGTEYGFRSFSSGYNLAPLPAGASASRAQQSRAGGDGGIHVHYHGDVHINNGLDAEQHAQEIMRKIKNNRRM